MNELSKEELKAALAEAQQHICNLEKQVDDAQKIEEMIVAIGILPRSKFDQAREILKTFV